MSSQFFSNCGQYIDKSIGKIIDKTHKTIDTLNFALDIGSKIPKTYNELKFLLDILSIEDITSGINDFNKNELPDKNKLVNTINKLQEVINILFKYINISKLSFDLYDEQSESRLKKSDKEFIDEKYNTPEYLYYYTKAENQTIPLPNSKLNLLTFKIMPLNFNTHSTLNEEFQNIFAFGKLLDCFINIANKPNFFEDYFVNIGINGLHIIDIEIILGLFINLLLMDKDVNTKPVYTDGKITHINNIFDLLFKFKHINFNKITKFGLVDILATILKKQINNEINTAITELFNLFDEQTKNELTKLYEHKCMSISVFIAYLIKSIKNIPILSLINFGYINDLANDIINNAIINNFPTQIGGTNSSITNESSTSNDAFSYIVNLIYKTVIKTTYACSKIYFSGSKINITKNMTYKTLLELFKNDNTTLISILNDKKKYIYISKIVLTFSIKNVLEIEDKKILNPSCSTNSSLTHRNTTSRIQKHNQLDKVERQHISTTSRIQKHKQLDKAERQHISTTQNSPLNTYFKSYDIIFKVIDAPSIFEVIRLSFDLLKFIALYNRKIMKLTDNIFNNIFSCEPYNYSEDFEAINLLLQKLPSTFSSKNKLLIRHNILKCIIAQNLYILGAKYNKTQEKISKREPINKKSNTKSNNSFVSANNRSINDRSFSNNNETLTSSDKKIIKLCDAIIKIICKKHKDIDEYKTELNELIKACLGHPNNLFGSKLTKLLSELVNYNFILYRKYIAAIKINLLKKNIIYENLLPTEKITKNNAQYPQYESTTNMPIFLLDIPNIISTEFSKKVKVAKTIYTNVKSIYRLLVSTDEYETNDSNQIQQHNSTKKETPTKANIEPLKSVNIDAPTIKKTVQQALDDIAIELNNATVNDLFVTNKQKIYLFILKLFEYTLFVSSYFIESNFKYLIKDNIMWCDETNIIINHLNNSQTGTLFDTKFTKSKVQFLSYDAGYGI